MPNQVLAELRWEGEQGALLFRDVRYLLIRPETLAAFQRAVEAEVGAARAGDLLYAGGFTGGRLSGERYRTQLGLDRKQAVEFMCRMGTEIGWGALRLMTFDAATRRFEVEARHSPFAAAYVDGASEGVCHLLRGVLGGLGSGLFEGDVVSREVGCAARGDAACRFVVEGQ